MIKIKDRKFYLISNVFICEHCENYYCNKKILAVNFKSYSEFQEVFFSKKHEAPANNYSCSEENSIKDNNNIKKA